MNASRTLELTPVGTACCEPSGPPAVTAEDAAERAVVFKALADPNTAEAAAERAVVVEALADPNRLRLLSIVENAPGGEACVCDLSQPVNRGQPAVSDHLKVMVGAGLLHREKRGTWAYYSLIEGALERVTGLVESL